MDTTVAAGAARRRRDDEDPLAERVDRLEADLAALAKQVAELRAALGE